MGKFQNDRLFERGVFPDRVSQIDENFTRQGDDRQVIGYPHGLNVEREDVRVEGAVHNFFGPRAVEEGEPFPFGGDRQFHHVLGFFEVLVGELLFRPFEDLAVERQARRDAAESVMIRHFKRVEPQDRPDFRGVARLAPPGEIEVVDISRSAVSEDRNEIGSEPRLQHIAQITGIILADQRPFGRVGMEREVGQGGEWRVGVRVLKEEEGELRVDSRRGPDLIGIVESRIEPDRTVFHDEPAVERNAEEVFLPLVEYRRAEIVERCIDRLNSPVDEELLVVDRLARIGSVVLRHRPGVQMFPDRAAEERGGMRVGGADDDRFPVNSAFFGDRVPNRIG